MAHLLYAAHRTKCVTIIYLTDLPNQGDITVSILSLRTLREVGYLPVVTQIEWTKLGHQSRLLGSPHLSLSDTPVQKANSVFFDFIQS